MPTGVDACVSGLRREAQHTQQWRASVVCSSIFINIYPPNSPGNLYLSSIFKLLGDPRLVLEISDPPASQGGNNYYNLIIDHRDLLVETADLAVPEA